MPDPPDDPTATLPQGETAAALGRVGLDGGDVMRLGRALVARHVSPGQLQSADYDNAVSDFAVGAIEAAERADPERQSGTTYIVAGGIWRARRQANAQRRRRRRDGASLEAIPEGAAGSLLAVLADPDAADPADVAEAVELRDAARRAIADGLRTLRRRHREAIIAVHLQGQTVVAVAAAAGVSRQTMFKRLRRGLAALRRAVEDADPELAALFRNAGRPATA